MDKLNEEQKMAVTSTEGYVRVIAGAGSGKTKALTNRYVYLVNELGISTSNILCVTFTNKAANEMKRRIRSMIGDQDTGLICTFHGFCVQLLREDIHTIHYPSNFVVMDSEDTDAILKNVYEQAHISSKNYTFTQAKDMISDRKFSSDYMKQWILSMDSNQLKMQYLHAEKIEERIFCGYLYEQKKCFGLDYDDLMIFALHILNEFQEKRKKWQKKLEYIMVDEFQDVSLTQYRLVNILSDYHKNLFVVGDPDQTIYSWRGAKIQFILNFDREHIPTKTIIMDKNYRSSETILNVSNSLISKNTKRIKKDLKSIRLGGASVLYHHAKTTKEEAVWIVNQIKDLINHGGRYQDITILYRSHFVSRSLEEELIKAKVPYVLYSGVEFYKRKEIKDILSYLRMIVMQDDLSFLRVINEPKRNIGKKRIALLKDYAEQKKCSLYQALKENMDHELIKKSKANQFVELIEQYQKRYQTMKITDLVMAVMNDTGYEAMLRQSGEEERLNNLAELKRSIFEYENNAGEETSLEDYLQGVSLFSNMDQEERKNSVKMMTVHTAKGLEFPYVFVCGLNEGIFPSKHVDTIDKLEEERRLAYVAYTRAEQALYLSDAEGFNYDGSFRFPSRFIFDVDKKYLTYTVELEERLLEAAARDRSKEQLSMKENPVYRVGDMIKHKIFGRGKIIGINQNTRTYLIQFETMTTPRNINIGAALEKIIASNS